MTTLSDAKLTALENLTSNTGHVNDLEAEYLLSIIVGTPKGNSIVDLWDTVFDEAAIAAGQFNDRLYAYMDSIVAPSTFDGFNARTQEYWENVDPGPAPAPPALASLEHWFDYTDAATCFSDAAGTILATNGSNLRNVTNKGTEGTPATNTTTPPQYLTNVVNGLNVADRVLGDVRLQAQAAAFTGANGGSIAAVARLTSFTGANPEFIITGIGNTAGQLMVRVNKSIGRWEAGIRNPFSIGTTKLTVINEWVYVYATHDLATGDTFVRASGAAEVAGNSVYIVPTGTPFFVNLLDDGDNQAGESMIWNKALNASERAALTAYFDAKYLTLPHV